MNYDETISALQILGGIPQNNEDANFTKLVPACFSYAEGRIHRDLNLLHTHITLLPLALQANHRDMQLPDDVLEVHYINVCTPAGAVTDNSRRHHLERISHPALNVFWPQPSFKRGLPKKYSVSGSRELQTQQPNPGPPSTQPLPPIWTPERYPLIVRVMPTPDRPYMLEVNADVETAPLSKINPETIVSRKYPELMIAACMVYIAGAQRDYGAASDDPSRAMSWETQYLKLLAGVRDEAARLRALVLDPTRGQAGTV